MPGFFRITQKHFLKVMKNCKLVIVKHVNRHRASEHVALCECKGHTPVKPPPASPGPGCSSQLPVKTLPYLQDFVLLGLSLRHLPQAQGSAHPRGLSQPCGLRWGGGARLEGEVRNLGLWLFQGLPRSTGPQVSRDSPSL